MAARDALTDEQLACFEARGYVLLRGALPQEIARSWAAEVFRRLREDPAGWVVPTGRADVDDGVAGFDLDDPRTWRRPFLSTRGGRSWRIAEHFPRVWEAMGALLGGPERIRTGDWTDYAAVNLGRGRPAGRARRLLLEASLRWRPMPRGRPAEVGGFHVDQPSPRATLPTLRNGLVTLALVTDAPPHGGPTALAVGSAQALVRRLAASPGGVDLTSPAVLAEAMGACYEVDYAEGRAGDVFLLHPLLVHAASENLRAPRVLGNPNIELARPLDVGRPEGELSVLERTTRGWIQAAERRAAPGHRPAPGRW